MSRSVTYLRSLIPALSLVSAVLCGAQDAPGEESESEAAPEPEVRIDLEYSMKTDLSALESREIRSAVLKQIRALYPKGSRTRRENLALLADAHLLSSMYPGIRNPADRADALALLLGVRDEFLSYAAARPGDYAIKNELAFLVGIGFPAFAEDDFYRSVRLTQELAAQVYNAMPNAKAAYIPGQGYLAANPAGRPAQPEPGLRPLPRRLPRLPRRAVLRRREILFSRGRRMSAEVKREVKLQVRNLCRDYHGGLGVTAANRNISFETSGGDIVWVRGRSGSGKTTLMNMITALDRPTSGSLAYLGRDYSELNDRQKTHMRRDAMGLMFQHFELLPMLSGYENIRVPYLLGKGGGGRNRKSRMSAEASNPAIDALAATIRDDLAFLAKKVTRISGGQRQIINIIRAALHRPPCSSGMKSPRTSMWGSLTGCTP